MEVVDEFFSECDMFVICGMRENVSPDYVSVDRKKVNCLGRGKILEMM
jgi:hypothetical protein